MSNKLYGKDESEPKISSGLDPITWICIIFMTIALAVKLIGWKAIGIIAIVLLSIVWVILRIIKNTFSPDTNPDTYDDYEDEQNP